jgi:Outer membrane protein beta-barrel domain
MRQLRLFFIGFFALTLWSHYAISQPSARTEGYWSVGAQLNAFNYFGDLNPLHQYTGTRIDFTRPNFAINVTRKLSNHWHVRGALGYGRLRGDDYNTNSLKDLGDNDRIGRYGRNLSFRNDVIELSFVAQYDIFKSNGRFYRRRYINPYLFAGIALAYHNPKAKVAADYNGSEAGKYVALRPLSTEGQGLPGYAKKYGLFQPAIPIGAGIKFRLTDRIDFGIEMGFRILFTDHIDDVGGRYAFIEDLRTKVGPLSAKMADRSAESVAVVSGENRFSGVDPKVLSLVGGITNRYPTNPDNLTTGGSVIVAGFERRAGYGAYGTVRGNGNRKGSNGFNQNDLYLVTGFHLNYVLTTRRHPRYKVN